MKTTPQDSPTGDGKDAVEIEVEEGLDAPEDAVLEPVVVSESPDPGSELVTRDALGAWFAEVGKHPLLTREEEHDLAVRYQEENDPAAFDKLVLSNLRLVVKIAMEYRRVWTNLADLIQEGNVGLVQGVERFDPQRGVKLSSYAAYWIRAYILKYLIDNIRLVRVGSSRAERKLFFQLNRAKRELERAGLEAEPRLLAEKIGVKDSEVVDMESRLAQGDLSLDAPARRDEPDSASFGDFIAGQERGADEIVGDQLMRETFHRYVDRFSKDLDERDTRILRERVLADEPLTLQQLGDEFGLTRERVRQVEKKLVERLGAYLRENLVDFDYWSPEG